MGKNWREGNHCKEGGMQGWPAAIDYRTPAASGRAVGRAARGAADSAVVGADRRSRGCSKRRVQRASTLGGQRCRRWCAVARPTAAAATEVRSRGKWRVQRLGRCREGRCRRAAAAAPAMPMSTATAAATATERSCCAGCKRRVQRPGGRCKWRRWRADRAAAATAAAVVAVPARTVARAAPSQ